MKLKLSAKSIFIILIVLIITILAFNYINRNSLLNSEKNLQKIFQKLMISTKGDQIDIGSNLVKSNVNCC